MPPPSAEPVDLLLAGGTVVSMDAHRRVWQRGYVAVRGGAIVGVGDLASCHSRPGHTIDTTGLVVIPGLVNCHTHLSHGVYRGLLDELPLADWAGGGVWNLVRDSDRETCYAGARVSLTENVVRGVTTVAAGEMSSVDVHAIDGVLQAVRESGIRALVARMSADSDDETDASQTMPAAVREGVDTALAEVSRLRAEFAAPTVEVVPEPLGILRCTPRMVREMAAYARTEQCRMTMHVASSHDEIAECRRRYGMGCIEKLQQLGVLGEHLLIAHCLRCSPDEMRLLADTGTGVSHNPVSNLMYALGVAPLAELLDAGVRVGLGTDGSSTNNGQDLWETMKMAVFLQKDRQGATWGSAELALELATIGGAQALGMDDTIGSIEIGKRADLVVLDPGRPGVAPRSTWVSNLVYAPDSSAVRTVLVDGRPVAVDGKVVAWDDDLTVQLADAAALALDERGGLAAKYRARSRWRWIDSSSESAG